MQRVPKILQLPVIIDRSWPLSSEPRSPQKLDSLFTGIAAQGRIPKEFFQSWLDAKAFFRFPFNKFKPLWAANGE
jgi:hypothetical protein